MNMHAKVREGMFPLREVHHALKGQWIVRMRAPLTSGLARLRGNLEDCCFLVFDHITDFDYDGVMTSIGQVVGFQSRTEAEHYAKHLIDECVRARLTQEHWKQQDIAPREANILPATGNLLPGKLPEQFVFSALRANEYDSCYFRVYIIEAEPRRLVDELLSYDFFADDFANYLLKLGNGS